MKLKSYKLKNIDEINFHLHIDFLFENEGSELIIPQIIKYNNLVTYEKHIFEKVAEEYEDNGKLEVRIVDREKIILDKRPAFNMNDKVMFNEQLQSYGQALAEGLDKEKSESSIISQDIKDLISE